MKIWLVSMECTGIAEAGGVKDVTYSLCDNFSRNGHDVTLFIPYFGCTRLDSLENFKKDGARACVGMCGQQVEVTFSTARFISGSAKVVFVNHLAYSEKNAVYVYTEEDEKKNGENRKGMGHRDAHFLDSLLCKAVAAYGAASGESPDILHCQDASTAMTPAFIELMKPGHFSSTKSVVTIHNAGPAYHHEFSDMAQAVYYTELPWNWIQDAMNENRVEPFLLAAPFSTLTTVSTYYAEEITDEAYSPSTDGLSGIFHRKNIEVVGITNGIDYYKYSPEHPEISRLPFAMNPYEGDFKGKLKNRKFFMELCGGQEEREDGPGPSERKAFLENFTRHGFLEPSDDLERTFFLTYHGRLVWQKGLHILADALEILLPQEKDVRVAIVGQGDSTLEHRMQEIAGSFPGKIVYLKGYNRPLSRLSVAQADFAVFPSNFEPCCLEDFVAQLFGTIPIAHATGGLKKIIDGETGFLYSPNDGRTLAESIGKAIRLKAEEPQTLNDMAVWASNYVRLFYSWQYVTERYLNLFKKILQKD